ncbi:hypothetical protein DPMN_102078 [Dreissena polymorpha]|uniref:Uncharacterized protein n=1 Tax=Dreissena polymorpha TaxID=45954 RepID=A0A9D4LKG7_DREPO|nr:hypothetical protein DPMN_102078 [Dreissena polymorpha]
MSSPRKGYADFETMFKRHVLENKMLHNELKGLDNMKRKKMRELERDKHNFGKKYGTRVKSGLNLAVPSNSHYDRDTAPCPSARPRYIVSKHFPYSLKAWNNLTDVLAPGIDIYKSEILQSSESPVFFAKDTTRTPDETKSKKIGKVGDKKTMKNVASAEKVHGENFADIVDDLESGFRRRSFTNPVVMRESFRKRSNTVNVRPTSQSTSRLSKRNTQSTCIQSIDSDIDRTDPLSQSYPGLLLSATSNVPSDVNAENTKGLDIPAPENQDAADQVGNKEATYKCKTIPVIVVRPADDTEHFVADNLENSPLAMNNSKQNKQETLGNATPILTSEDDDFQPLPRGRSNTMDDGLFAQRKDHSFRELVTDVIHAGRKPALCDIVVDLLRGKRRGIGYQYSISFEGYSGFRRGSLFDKLLSASCSSIYGGPARKRVDINELKKCRYIRIPGENINGSREEISLENLDFHHISFKKTTNSGSIINSTNDSLSTITEL